MYFRIIGVLVCVAGILLGASFWAPKTEADFYAGLGTVTNQTQITPCSLIEWGGANSRNFDTTMQSCWSATLHGCGTITDMPFVYAYAPPAQTSKAAGTVVMFSGDGGTDAAFSSNFSTYVEAYEDAGYQVVEVAWGPYQTNGTAWELASPNPGPTNSSILAAACRPASFLNWVRNGAYPSVGAGIWGLYKGGMCAHGDSGGAAALGYALAWYNGGVGGAPTWGSGYLDKVVMENGPVFTDIDKGCQVTCNQSGLCGNTLTTQICNGSNQTGGNPNGCNNWTPAGQSMNYPLEYTSLDSGSVNLWTGNTASGSLACATNNNSDLSTTYDSAWQQMSIQVPPNTIGNPVFNYPNTGMSAWLCESLGSNTSWNNATAQGGLFYQKFTAQSAAGGQLSVNGVLSCLDKPENIESGIVTVNTVTYGPPPTYQYPVSQAIINDMTGATVPATSCQALGALRPPS